MNISQIARCAGQVQAPDRSAPAGRPGFGVELILLSLDVETLRTLEEALFDFPGRVVVVSHDCWFLDRIATHILAFEGDSQPRGSKATTPPIWRTAASACGYSDPEPAAQ